MSGPPPAMRVLVIDDEPPARAKVARLLAKDLRFHLVGEAADGLSGLAQIELLQPDLLLLDIQMPGLSGFELLDALPDALQLDVVFSTAYEQHALRAFDAHAVDYLLKPYAAQRFARALDKAFCRHLGSAHTARRELVQTALRTRHRLVLKAADGAWLNLPTVDILRITAANKFVCVHSTSGQHLVRQPLRDLELRLDESFARSHRGELVNLTAVVKVEPRDHGDATVTLRDGTELVLTRTHRQTFLEHLRAVSR